MDFRTKFARNARRARISVSIDRGIEFLAVRRTSARVNAFMRDYFDRAITRSRRISSRLGWRRFNESRHLFLRGDAEYLSPLNFCHSLLVTRLFPVRPCEPGCENFPTSFFVRDCASVVSSFFSEKVLTTLRLWKITTEFFVNEILNFFCRFFVINFKCSNNVRSN